MAGILTVQTLQGPTTGANANQVLVPSNNTLVGGANSIIQVGYDETTDNGVNYSVSNATLYNTLRVTLTRKQANSYFLIQLSTVIYRATTSGEARAGVRFSVNGGSTTDYWKYIADGTAWNRSALQHKITTTGSIGDTCVFESMLQNTVATDNRFRTPDLSVWEIAQ